VQSLLKEKWWHPQIRIYRESLWEHKLYPLQVIFLVVVAQIGDRAFLATWSLEDADALPVPQQSFVKIVDGSGVQRQ